MKKNLANIDRVLRILLAVAIAVLAYMNVITGTLAVVLMVAAVIFVVTGFISFCPIYYILGLSTRKKSE